MANPLDGSVVAGAASIQATGNTLNINQSSDRAIINWQGFSVGSNQIANFNLPSSSSATLNRVTGTQMSVIAGQLNSNGQVFLINPHGVLFGNGAQINVGGLTASTLDISNQQFMQRGDLNFQGSSKAGVINRGLINATDGNVNLIGSFVENHGQINAPLGNVNLGAGQTVLLQGVGSRLVVEASTSGLDHAVTNTGTINAIQAQLAANGGNVYGLAVNTKGTIRATGAVKKDGRVLLVANGGEIQASGNLIAKNDDGSGGTVRVDAGPGGTANVSADIDVMSSVAGGGEVDILGAHVNLLDQSRINASGLTAGGSVRVGGGFQGRDADVPNAQATSVDPSVSILADATGSGDGGRVIVWSDDMTKYAGSISARGGATGGDGGFIEVSGKKTLLYDGVVDTLAPAGANGDILFDPGTVNIGGPASTPTGDRTFTAEQVRTAWWSGNLTITAPDDGNNSAGPPDINVLEELFPARPSDTGNPVDSPNDLNLTAAGDLNIAADISNEGTGDFNFSAEQEIKFSANLTATGNFALGGDIDLIAGGDVVLDTSLLGREVRITSFNGNINVNGRDVNLFGSSAGNAVLSTQFGTIDVDAGRDVLLESGLGIAQIGFDESGFVNHPVLVNAVRDVILRANGEDGRAQIGVGAIGAETLALNFISVRAGRSIAIEASGENSTAMIGNGSPNSSGFTIAAIRVSAANDLLIVGGGTNSTAQIGNGGMGADWTSDSFLSTIDVDANDITLMAGGVGSHAQIGTGGTDAEGTGEGAINVLARENMTIKSDSTSSLAQVGHGGMGYFGTTLGDIEILVGHGLELRASLVGSSRIGHQIDPGEDYEGDIAQEALMSEGDIVVAIDQSDPLADGGGRLFMSQQAAIDAGGSPNEVRIFGTRRAGNDIEDGANINGIRFDAGLPPGTLAGDKWNENREFFDWDHERWGYSFLDANDPSLPYVAPFEFYYLNPERPEQIQQFPYDQFERYALWAESLQFMFWNGLYSMYYGDPAETPWKSITGSSSAELYGESDEE